MTIRVDIEANVDRPIEEVFSRLADIGAYRTWLPRSGIYRDSALVDPRGTVGAGTTFYDDTTYGRFEGRVTVFEPPTKIEFVQVLKWGGMRLFESRPGYVLQSSNGNTRVHHYGEARPYGLLKLLEPVFRIIARRERKRVVDELSASMTRN